MLLGPGVLLRRVMRTTVTSPEYMLAIKRTTRSRAPILLGRVTLGRCQGRTKRGNPCGLPQIRIFTTAPRACSPEYRLTRPIGTGLRGCCCFV
jgi:hypothetical protein